jgi:3-O-methylgallate 3,4-dioxygenase
MAAIVGGFASSHTAQMALPGESWVERFRGDSKNGELITVPGGVRVTYEELLAQAKPGIAKQLDAETCVRKFENIQKGLDELETRFGQTDMDVVVMFGNDQGEWFYDDNMPAINVYWGENVHILPRPGWPESWRLFPTEECDWPVDAELGLHVIESLAEQDFDIAHTRYQHPSRGGTIGPSTWYMDFQRAAKSRPIGVPHAYSMPIGRWFSGKTVPIVPITINTCYPPNWISPRRAYTLGRAVREAVDAWHSDKKVAFVSSGGLSHFVVDEDLDRIALKGMQEADGETLTTLPRSRLQSASTEILNWVAISGAMGTPMETISYEPAYRSPAGTGVGIAVGHWQGNATAS